MTPDSYLKKRSFPLESRNASGARMSIQQSLQNVVTLKQLSPGVGNQCFGERKLTTQATVAWTSPNKRCIANVLGSLPTYPKMIRNLQQMKSRESHSFS